MQTTGFKTIVDSYLLLVSIQLYSYDSVREIVLVPYFLHHTDWSAAFFRDASTFGLTQSFSTSNHHVKMRCPWLSEVSWQVYCMCRAKGLGFAFLSPLFMSYWCGRIPTEVCRQVEEKYLKLCVECECLFISSPKRYVCSANIITLHSGPTGQPVRMTYFPLPLTSVFAPYPRDQSSGVIVSLFFFFKK